MVILKVQDLTKCYGEEPNQVHALDKVNLEIEFKEFVTIVGSSGSGKSTLLHMLGGLDVPTEGKVIVNGQDISVMKDEQLTVFRRRSIGFVFQAFNLIPILNVYENIVLPINLDKKEIDDSYVEEIIDTLGLSQKKYAMPNTLSGGQQQRVAIARALVTKPAILLADEPTGNLDSRTSNDVINILKLASLRYDQTLVMITHNEQIAKLANRIIRIEDGRIVDEVKQA